jgi:hypothetical protein
MIQYDDFLWAEQPQYNSQKSLMNGSVTHLNSLVLPGAFSRVKAAVYEAFFLLCPDTGCQELH